MYRYGASVALGVMIIILPLAVNVAAQQPSNIQARVISLVDRLYINSTLIEGEKTMDLMIPSTLILEFSSGGMDGEIMGTLKHDGFYISAIKLSRAPVSEVDVAKILVETTEMRITVEKGFRVVDARVGNSSLSYSQDGDVVMAYGILPPSRSNVRVELEGPSKVSIIAVIDNGKVSSISIEPPINLKTSVSCAKRASEINVKISPLRIMSCEAPSLREEAIIEVKRTTSEASPFGGPIHDLWVALANILSSPIYIPVIITAGLAALIAVIIITRR